MSFLGIIFFIFMSDVWTVPIVAIFTVNLNKMKKTLSCYFELLTVYAVQNPCFRSKYVIFNSLEYFRMLCSYFEILRYPDETSIV